MHGPKQMCIYKIPTLPFDIVNAFLEKYCTGENGHPFTVVFIKNNGKQRVMHCDVLDVIVDSYYNGDSNCVVIDKVINKVRCFNINNVLSINTTENWVNNNNFKFPDKIKVDSDVLYNEDYQNEEYGNKCIYNIPPLHNFIVTKFLEKYSYHYMACPFTIVFMKSSNGLQRKLDCESLTNGPNKSYIDPFYHKEYVCIVTDTYKNTVKSFNINNVLSINTTYNWYN